MNHDTIQLVLPVALVDVFAALAPEFEAETGHNFDVAIMLNPEVPGYIAQGHAWSIAASNPCYIKQVIAGSSSDETLHTLGIAPLSLAVTGTDKATAANSAPEIADILTAAESIAITEGGTSGSQFDHLLDKLDVRDAVEPKVRLLPGGGPIAALLAGGVEMAALPLTNVAPIAGVRSAALCPLDLNVHVDLAFCQHKNANNATHTFARWMLNRRQTGALQRLGLFKCDRARTYPDEWHSLGS